MTRAVSAGCVTIMKWLEPAISSMWLRAMRSCSRRAISLAVGCARSLGTSAVGTRRESRRSNWAWRCNAGSQCRRLRGTHAAIPQELDERRLEEHERAHRNVPRKRHVESEIAAVGVADDVGGAILRARERLDRPRFVDEEVRTVLRLGLRFSPSRQVGRAGGGGPVGETPSLELEVFYSSLSCLWERSRTSVFIPTSLRLRFSSSLPVSK